jgi:Staphylococcal nuclease homologue
LTCDNASVVTVSHVIYTLNTLSLLCLSSAYAHTQPYGPEAKQALLNFLKDKTVRVRFLQTDQYGRGVAQVWTGKIHPNYADEYMLKEGLAEVYEGAGACYGPKGKAYYMVVQHKAMADRIGIWSMHYRESAAEFKRRTKKLRVEGGTTNTQPKYDTTTKPNKQEDKEPTKQADKEPSKPAIKEAKVQAYKEPNAQASKNPNKQAHKELTTQATKAPKSQVTKISNGPINHSMPVKE